MSKPAPLRNVAVVSAAGAGKTRALTRRFLELYLHPANYPLASLYGITFTNDAAAEMIARILRYLDLLASGRAENAGEEELVREFAARDPNVKALAARKKEELLHRLAELHLSTFHSLYADFLAGMPFAAGILPGYAIIDEAAEALVFADALEQFLIELRREPATRAAVQELLAGQETGLRYQCEETYRELAPRFEELRGLVAREEAIRRRAQSATTGLATALGEFLAAVERAGQTAGKLNAHLATLADRCAEWRRQPAPDTLPDPILDGSVSAKKYIVTLRAALPAQEAAALDRALAGLAPAREEYLRAQSDLALVVHLKPFLRLDAIFTALKRERNQVSFDDIEGLTLTALRDAGSLDYLAFKIGGEIRHLLIDEFQDTSFRQLAILEPLFEELTAGSPDEKSLFYVGDPGQAIYRWRGGAAESFAWLKQRFAGRIADDTLPVNYRCREEVVRFVNEVLGRTDQAGPEAAGGWVRVEDLGHFSPKSEGHHACLTRTGDLVEELVRARHYEPGEIAVLVRSNRFGTAVLGELTARGLPVTSKSQADLAHAPEVGLVLALLRFLDRPESDLALLTALIGIFGLEVDAVRGLAAGGTLYAGLRRHRPRDRATVTLGRLLAQVDFVSPYELLFRLLELTRLPLTAPLAALLDAALGFAGETDATLAAFLDWYDRAGSLTPVAEKFAGGVQIQTIHKAKGLEFGIVIIPETNLTRGTTENDKLMFTYDRATGRPDTIYWRKFGKPLGSLKAEEQERLRRDELNLLYVAMTRAKNGLHLLGYSTGKEKPDRGLWFETIERGTGRVVQARGALEERPRPVGKPKRDELFGPLPAPAAPAAEPGAPVAGIKLEILDPRRQAGMALGELLHLALKRIEWLDGREVDAVIDDAVAWCRRQAVRTAADETRLEQKVRPLLRQSITAPELRPLFYRDGRELAARREQELYFIDGENGRHTLARLDRLLLGPGRATIIDFKTGSRERDYDEQLARYRRGLGLVYPELKVETMVVYLENK